MSVTNDGAVDLSLLEPVFEEYRGQSGALIPILQKAQDLYGYLPKVVIAAISKKTRIPISQLYGVVTFYAQFRLTRRGRHLIRICDGTACHVSGAPRNIEAIEKAFDVPARGTSSDYKYTLEIVYCIGSCGLAPVAVVDDKVYGQTGSEALVRQVKKLT